MTLRRAIFQSKLTSKAAFTAVTLLTLALVFVYLYQQSKTSSPTDAASAARRESQNHASGIAEHEPEPVKILFSYAQSGWSRLLCEKSPKLRVVSVGTDFGNLTLYVYSSSAEDKSVTSLTLRGQIYEQSEIARFLSISKALPLIDVGANVGLVSLQAALQGRQVVAVEAIRENAVRLCRSALDFGHASLVRVINNAASSKEGNITLAMDQDNTRTHFEVIRSPGWGYGATVSYAIHLDRVLDVTPFTTAALKIDVESHEGHVLAGAEQLFQKINIPIIWMEWEHVKKRKEYGGEFVVQFMQRHNMEPYDLMSEKRLEGNFMKWPFSILWLKRKTTAPST